MFKLEFSTANAAFGGDPTIEIARILRALADSIDGKAPLCHSATVRDLNGNRIGSVEFDARAEV